MFSGGQRKGAMGTNGLNKSRNEASELLNLCLCKSQEFRNIKHVHPAIKLKLKFPIISCNLRTDPVLLCNRS